MFPAAPAGSGAQRNTGTKPAGDGQVPEGVAADVVQPVVFGAGELTGALPGALLKVCDVEMPASGAGEHPSVGSVLRWANRRPSLHGVPGETWVASRQKPIWQSAKGATVEALGDRLVALPISSLWSV